MSNVKAAAACSVTEVTSPGIDADAVRDLFLEYGETLGFNTCFAGFDEELISLPGDYALPRGCLLLAKVEGKAAGCVGIRPLEDRTSCEMKRLYVRPPFRRARLGWRLTEAAISRAREMGCRRIVLDTLPAMREARALYAALGFRLSAPYYDNALIGSDCYELML